MDPSQERIQADLRGLVSGEVRCDDLFTQMYASDASLYELRPTAVVRPRTTDDVVATVRYAAERGLPIHARGAGTGLAGESIGPGIVIDFSFGMRRVTSVNEETVTIQPGVVYGQLNRLLARDGRHFGPDPANAGVTTMGSVLALDGAGSRRLAYGSARRHVRSLQLVLADGEVVEAGREEFDHGGGTRREELVRRLSDLCRREANVIETHRPKSVANRCGYQIYDALRGDAFDLAGSVVGSEGTLALITQAVVETQPLPKVYGQVLLFFDRLESAAIAAVEAGQLGIAACDLLDRRLLSLAGELHPRYGGMLPRESEAMLVVEVQGDDENIVRETTQNVLRTIRFRQKLAFEGQATLDREEIESFRRLIRRISPMLHKVGGAERPLPFVEDIAVPPLQLAAFLVRLQNVLKEHRITASLFGHAAHGQLHIRPFLDPSDPEQVRGMTSFAEDLYEQVLAVGGTISGEHGAGLSRTWYLRRQFGPLYDVFREVKRVFDPANTFNPGKVIADVPQPLTKNMRPSVPWERPTESVAEAVEVETETEATNAGVPMVPEPETVPLHLSWNRRELFASAQACNGCGRCRTQSPEYRMCPIFHMSPREEASPRAKANLVRGLLSGALTAGDALSDELRTLADLCVGCHQCRLECPAEVDIPKLVIEAKAQHGAANGFSVVDSLLASLDRLAAWIAPFRSVANYALGSRWFRAVLDRTLGIARRRKLPRFAAQSFLRIADRKKLSQSTGFHARRSSTKRVLYFVDTYANWFDTELAEAFTAILHHHGIETYVPSNQQGSGMARITMGDVERAKPAAAANVRLLAEAVRQGYEIITTEPSAALCLKREYVQILGDEESKLVAEHTSEACDFLWRMHKAGELALDLRPINASVGYHLPCHSKAMSSESAGEQLLRLIPGLTVERLEKGCSGMAGVWGIKSENFRNSVRVGFELIAALRGAKIEVGSSECSACKMQMEQGTTKPTIHPLKILASAYGLLPDSQKLFAASREELLVS